MRIWCSLTGTHIDECEPAFQDLAQSSSSLAAAKTGEREEGSDGEDEENNSDVDGNEINDDVVDVADGAGDAHSSDRWITAVYEELQVGDKDSYAIAAVSANIHAHRVQCRRFPGAHALGALTDYLDLLRVSANCSLSSCLYLTDNTSLLVLAERVASQRDC